MLCVVVFYQIILFLTFRNEKHVSSVTFLLLFHYKGGLL